MIPTIKRIRDRLFEKQTRFGVFRGCTSEELARRLIGLMILASSIWMPQFKHKYEKVKVILKVIVKNLFLGLLGKK